MKFAQQLIFPDLGGEQIVNVASVAHRSPFRYPGGKTWLIPKLRQWIGLLPSRPSVFIEPFAGGAISGLTAAFESWADHVILAELDDQVAAVWKIILSDDSSWLVHRILSFDLTEQTAQHELSKQGGPLRERAFRALLKNRIVHGGILAPGSSLMRFGENGKGIRSRWYAQTLAKRIIEINKRREMITFVHGDGFSVIKQYARRKSAVYFVDPPYTKAGKMAGARLYTHHQLDHEFLFKTISKVSGDFLMTYDSTPEIVSLATQYGFQVSQVPMKNTHHAKLHELLIGRDITWNEGAGSPSSARLPVAV